jgi:O-antigen chain-terminating methyltransferase
MQAIAPLVQKVLYAEQAITETRDQISENRNQIAETRNQIAENRDQISENRNQIAENRNQIAETRNQIAETRNQISENRNQIAENRDQITNAKAILRWTNSQEFSDQVTKSLAPSESLNLFYHDFEDTFRGSQALIRERLIPYLLKLKAYMSDFENAVFVDIGCGRGEWLDILKGEGVRNYTGIDMNKIQLSICRENGHTVMCQDCNSYLDKLPKNSVDVITGFQIIEHLKFEELLLLFALCKKVLRPNGVIIFETPNPENINTGANYFYIDPTHQRPISQEALKFIAEHSGFSEVEIIRLNPCECPLLEKPLKQSEDYAIWEKNIDIINGLLYGPQDYSVWAINRGGLYDA